MAPAYLQSARRSVGASRRGLLSVISEKRCCFTWSGMKSGLLLLCWIGPRRWPACFCASQLLLEFARGDAARKIELAPLLKLAQDAPRHHHPMDLVGTVVDPRKARVTVHPLQRRVARHPERAVHLNGAVDYVVQHLGAPELD